MKVEGQPLPSQQLLLVLLSLSLSCSPPLSCSLPHVLPQCRREKSRQNSLERVGPLQDLLPALSPKKEYQHAAYRSVSPSEAFRRRL